MFAWRDAPYDEGFKFLRATIYERLGTKGNSIKLAVKSQSDILRINEFH